MNERPWDELKTKKGQLIVLSGPSGVGKDSVLDRLFEVYPAARRCITATTRNRRHDEANGVDYFFLSEKEFVERVEKGLFLEYANVHGNLYGTPKDWVLEQLGMGVDLILKIDVQGAKSVCEQIDNVITMFMVPPSMDELLRRLTQRKTETEDEIKRRFERAQKELEQMPNYDFIIENDCIDAAAEEIKAVLIASHCKNPRK